MKNSYERCMHLGLLDKLKRITLTKPVEEIEEFNRLKHIVKKCQWKCKSRRDALLIKLKINLGNTKLR